MGITNIFVILNSVMVNVYKVILSLDSIIYSFINYLFKLFLILAQAKVFTDEGYMQLVGRIYQVIGVVMLFMLSYAMLRKVVNPDSKDKESSGKMIINVVKAIVLLAIVPTIFRYAFLIQDGILEQNTIGKLILGTQTSSVNNAGEDPAEQIEKGGMRLALGVFDAFLFPDKSAGEDPTVYENMGWNEFHARVEKAQNFMLFKEIADKVEDDTLVYYWGMSGLAGIFVIYMLASYCLSLGFRLIKLVFYEVMAPVCIIASIIPSQKDMLSKWIKSTLTTFTEVFIRIGILYFSIYVLNLLRMAYENNQLISEQAGASVKALGYAIIIMGLVTFMKSAPDLISKLTGIDSGSMSLGLKDQLAKGGFFTAGAMLGGAITSGTRNAVAGITNAHARRKEATNAYKAGAISKKDRNKAYRRAVGGGLLGLGSGAAGFASGGVHSFNKDAKSFEDMKAGAAKGAKASMEAKHARQDRKDRYKADGKNFITGRASDVWDTAKDWATGGAAQYEADIATGKNYGDKFNAIKASAKEFREKWKSSNALINQGITVNDWKGDNTSKQQLQMKFKELQTNNGGQLSLFNLEEYINQLSASKIDRASFAPGTVGDADFQRAQLARTNELSLLTNMKAQLEKQADMSIMNAAINTDMSNPHEISINGLNVTGTKGVDLMAVNSGIENFRTEFNLSGANIKDKVTGDSYSGRIGTAEQIKDISEMAEHNADLARREAAAYERAKAAREGKKDNK